MDKFKEEVIRIALDDLFNDHGSFYITTINDLGDTLGVNVRSHPDYNILRSLHCVSYSKMSPEMKAELPSRVMSVLSSKFNTDLMAKALIAVSTGEVKDLPCIEDVEVTSQPKLSLYRS